jgi:hypothetical protein
MECAVSSSSAGDLGAAPAPTPARRWRRLDDLRPSPNLEVRPAFNDELLQLSTLLTDLIPGIAANFSSFCDVHSYSKSIYSVLHRSSLVGCFACLHLNPKGLEKLLDGTLSMVEPQRACLAESGSRVEAIYAWAWAMRPPTNGIRAMGNWMTWLRRPHLVTAEIYGRPLTEKGMGFGHNLGSRRVDNKVKGQGLWVIPRSA